MFKFYFFQTLKYLIWFTLTCMGVGAAWACAVIIFFLPSLESEVKQLQDMEALMHDNLEIPLRVYSADNKLIAEFGEHRRTKVSYAQIPNAYKDALLAAEDTDFYEHHGVDIKGLLRAALQLADSGRIQSGGSTITMQVARNYLLTRDRTFARKIREILLSLRIEHQLSKQEILELYVNKIYLGNKAYGIAAAAEAYYGKQLHQLNLAQLAMIAGLPKAPSAYNPLANPRRALIRRNWILQRMYSLGKIDDASYEAAIRAPISAGYHPPKTELDAPYAAESARIFAQENFGAKTYTSGLKVYTSLISQHQLAANKAVQNGLLAYDKRHGWRGVEQQQIPLQAQASQDEALDLQEAAASNLEQLQAALQDPRAKRLESQLGLDISNWLRVLDATPVYANLEPAIVIKAEPELIQLVKKGGQLIEVTPKAWSWAGAYHSPFWKVPEAPRGDRLVKSGDLVRLEPNPKLSAAEETPWLISQLPALEASLVSTLTDTGEITALVGGFDFKQSHFNRAEQAMRQAGSIFKPFIYLAALEKGYTPATVINDAPIVFDDKQLEDEWRPQNSTGTFYGPTRLREALYKSRNLVSIRVLNYVGIRPAINYISKFGFEVSRMPRDLSLSLGSANVTPMEMNQAYAILANGGYPVTAHLVTKIEDADGAVIYQAEFPQVCRNCPEDQETLSINGVNHPVSKREVDPRAIYTMHSILRDVVEDGTGKRAQALNRDDIRGKTGTTNELHDAWFAGFNRDLVTSVWAGFDQPASTGEYGANLALPIWIDFMQVALKDEPEKVLARPEGLVTVRIDPETGRLASPGQNNAIFETFYQERVPEPSASSSSGLPSRLDTDTQTPKDAPPPESIF